MEVMLKWQCYLLARNMKWVLEMKTKSGPFRVWWWVSRQTTPATSRGRPQWSFLATNGSVRWPTKLCAAPDWDKDCWRLQLGAMGTMGAVGTVCNLSWFMLFHDLRLFRVDFFFSKKLGNNFLADSETRSFEHICSFYLEKLHWPNLKILFSRPNPMQVAQWLRSFFCTGAACGHFSTGNAWWDVTTVTKWSNPIGITMISYIEPTDLLYYEDVSALPADTITLTFVPRCEDTTVLPGA